MRFDSLIPVLDVRDVEASIDFYSTVLGFTIQDKVQWGGKTEWALLRTGQIQLMLCASGETGDDESNHPPESVFFVYLDNIEELRTFLRALGYDPQPRDLNSFSSRQDFYLRDPDGYVLWFSHSSSVADEAQAMGRDPIIIMQPSVAKAPS